MKSTHMLNHPTTSRVKHPGRILAASGVLSLVALLFSCSAPIKQFYFDTFYSEDHVYENKPLRILLTFRGNWNLITDPNAMDKSSREFAMNLQRSGVELLFIGSTVEGLHGTRGIAVNLNSPAREYAEYIHRINKNDIQNDQGLTHFLAGQNSMIKWQYDNAGFRFCEFFFNIDTYDVRIAFWTKPELFDNFLPVYEEIMSTLTLTGGL